MKTFLMKMVMLFFLPFYFQLHAQQEWMGELRLTKLECELKQACYTLEITGLSAEAWALGDQNYRLFFDAKNLSIVSVQSLLPETTYSQVQLNEVLELVGQGQETYSPLDHIDEELGFLDFSIIAYTKENMENAAKITPTSALKIAEICLEVSDPLLTLDGLENAVNLYFSRPETAGQITNQFSIITEIDEPNHTLGTRANLFVDVNYEAGLNGQLGKLCQTTTAEETDLFYNDIKIYPNPVTNTELLTYTTALAERAVHDILIHDASGKEIVYYPDLPAGNEKLRLQNRLTKGIYFLHLQTDTGHLVEKIIVME